MLCKTVFLNLDFHKNSVVGKYFSRNLKRSQLPALLDLLPDGSFGEVGNDRVALRGSGTKEDVVTWLVEFRSLTKLNINTLIAAANQGRSVNASKLLPVMFTGKTK